MDQRKHIGKKKTKKVKILNICFPSIITYQPHYGLGWGKPRKQPTITRKYHNRVVRR